MKRFFAVLIALAVAVPSPAWSCACGCGVFDVQTNGLLPTKPGGTAFLEYDYLNQNKNWSGASRGSDDANGDKLIRTQLITAGVHDMIDRSWGYQIEVPYWSRRFVKTDPGDGSIGTFDHGSVGDIRVRGVFTGFSPDMSTGVTFGLKLPTGDFENSNFDRDTQIGTGSTDLLLGAYRMGRFADAWGWFANAQWDQPLLTAAGYRPGAELGAAGGVYYEGWAPGDWTIAPLAQAIASNRWSDSGTASNAPNSGYRRVLLSPGLEVGTGVWRADASFAFPVYQYATGNQLMATEYYRLVLSRRF